MDTISHSKHSVGSGIKSSIIGMLKDKTGSDNKPLSNVTLKSDLLKVISAYIKIYKIAMLE